MTPADLHVVAEVRVPVLMSISQAAEVLGRSPKTVRRRVDDGALPAVIENGRIMIRGDELLAYIEGLQRPVAISGRRRRSSGAAGSPYARLAS